MYKSLEEYEKSIREQYLSLQGHPIESHPKAFMALATSVVFLAEGLRKAREMGKPQVWRNNSTGEAMVVCHPTGEIELAEEGAMKGFLTVKRAEREARDTPQEPKYTDMTFEEGARFAEMAPISEDDVLDMHRFLEGLDDLSGLGEEGG